MVGRRGGVNMTDETIPLWEAIDLVRHERRSNSRAAFEWVRDQVGRGELKIVAMMGPGERADPNLYSAAQIEEMWERSSSLIEYGEKTGFLWSLVSISRLREILIRRKAAHQSYEEEVGQVRASRDYNSVCVRGRYFAFRGSKQRQVVGYLYNAWQSGQPRVSVAMMWTDLEFSDGTRLRDLFKGHPDWQDLIAHKQGACWLKI